MTTINNFNLDAMQILIVEDDAETARLIAHILTQHGARAEVSCSGEDALGRFRGQRFPLIITDICMPGMDGIELAGRIRKIDRDTLFIATSASRETECLISAIELGFSDYLLKPLTAEKILLAVKHCSETISAHKELQYERTKFKTVVESLSECLAIKTLDLQISYQNPAMTAMFGDLSGAPCYSMWRRKEPCESCPTVLTMADGLPHSATRNYILDGRVMTVETATSPIKDQNGAITGTVEIIRDISAQARTERLLHNIARGVSAKIGAEYLHSLTNFLTEALEMDFALVGTLSKDGNRVETLAFSRKGINCEERSYDLKGTPCRQAIDNGIQFFPKDAAKLFPDDADLTTLSIESYCGAPLIDSKGVTIGILCTFHTAPIYQQVLVGDIISIFASRAAAELERIRNEQTIRDMAFHDPLTGLSNRRLFEDRLEQAVAKSRRYYMNFGLITLDLDYFKKINDTLGHDAGDKVLIEAGERIRACCKRDLDTISRYGGDEFCMIITDCGSREQLDAIARQMLEKFARPILIRGIETQVTASIGISMFPDDGNDAVQLKIASDRAMYAAKNAGRNTYTFSPPDSD
ncbi:MAG: hypothetical protein A2076_14075 [Geobacteraceae bacterium GWC2_53_11]|nr:MAG: hypothetical protein A2076_14075 [Geobacteraceae bacterium GWC2_53_11]